MQFKNPEILYALFLLLIPIVIHLFQLRKFQKEAFTNVAFLKKSTLQTRKSSQIKKWLVLCTRLLLLAAIITAFAQPFTTNSSTFNTKKETVIYLDNSFSMQAKGNQGDLLKRAVQDIISNVPEDETISLITNDNVFRKTTIKAIKNDLLQLEYAANTITPEAAILKSNTYFGKEKSTLKNLIFISDFQQDRTSFNPKTDVQTNLHLVQLKPVITNNIALDSAYISEKTLTSIELKVQLKNSGKAIENLPVSLFNNDKLIAKTSVSIKDQVEATFSLPSNEIINGEITLDDANLQFDNHLYFNINKTSKIKVLSVNNENDSFLKRIFTDDEFDFTSTPENQLNYTLLNQQNVVILNELNSIPNALIGALKSFTNQGGSLVIIPSNAINLDTYNQLLNNFGSNFSTNIQTEKRITTINYAHPLYNSGVFEKQVDNFQYPTTKNYYPINSKNASAILKFEDGKSFLSQIQNTYIFSSPLNTKQSSFKNSPLIVPTFYNMGKFSLKNPALYYTIGKENTYDIAITLQQDAILSLENGSENSIPKQQYFNNKVVVSTSETPAKAAIYTIKNKNESIKNVSYNYSRDESALTYRNLEASKNITVSNSITDIFDTIKSDAKINALWKWFVIFALALLIIEMLILKYFK